MNQTKTMVVLLILLGAAIFLSPRKEAVSGDEVSFFVQYKAFVEKHSIFVDGYEGMMGIGHRWRLRE